MGSGGVGVSGCFRSFHVFSSSPLPQMSGQEGLEVTVDQFVSSCHGTCSMAERQVLLLSVAVLGVSLPPQHLAPSHTGLFLLGICSVCLSPRFAGDTPPQALYCLLAILVGVWCPLCANRGEHRTLTDIRHHEILKQCQS